MKPIIAIVGRPNVGKSTLFNRFTRSRDALVADLSGLTRDRHYGEGRMGERPFIIIDTGGFEPIVKDGILAAMARQTMLAITESDAIIFLVDGRVGLTAQDREIAKLLRKSGRPVFLSVNKLEGMSSASSTADFFELGLGEPQPLSSAHGDGVRELLDNILDKILPSEDPSVENDRILEAPEIEQSPDSNQRHPVRFAVVGRPNVGKSTLVNTLLGEERMIAFDEPGTTRDSIEVSLERNGRLYTLIDTAGVRRRGKVFEAVEKFSVVKTLQSIEQANVVVLLLDAQQEIADQDAHLAGFILESGRALVVGVNKWDNLDADQRDTIKRSIDRKLKFLTFARFHFISALQNQGVGGLLSSVDQAYAAATAKLSTPKLTRVLQQLVEQQQPPRKGIFRPKLRYAHQGGRNPPTIIIHGNALDAISDNYKRYLESRFRETFRLQGTPLRIEFRSSKNPYLEK